MSVRKTETYIIEREREEKGIEGAKDSGEKAREENEGIVLESLPLKRKATKGFRIE